jgi:hypothetical protein
MTVILFIFFEYQLKLPARFHLEPTFAIFIFVEVNVGFIVHNNKQLFFVTKNLVDVINFITAISNIYYGEA